MRVAKASAARHDRIIGQTRAMAWGLALLESGEPPQTPYACRVATNPANPTSLFVITFQNTAPWEYSVNVRPATADDSGLPLAPTDFGPGNGKPLGQDVPPPMPPPAAPPAPPRLGRQRQWQGGMVTLCLCVTMYLEWREPAVAAYP